MEQIELNETTYDSCVERMCRAVMDGELIAFPTDTVYGLGGTAFSRKVLEKLLTVKPDRNSKPTAILMDSLIRLSQFGGDVPGPKIVKLSEMYWPGPLTMIWHVSSTIPEEFHGKDKTLGYRIPNSEFLLEVMRRTERPLWATSANLPGRPAPRLFSELDPMVVDACDLVIKTKSLLLGKSSSVVDVRGKHAVVLREGAVLESDIEKIWKKA
ncbi:MAG: threonylcarbamoyl-AMP synthase [Calditrichaeota bacterium]|nr:threonylcarbamoyl-AMP synthase [Calditrichota bacterium]MCB9368381.1 threonylcarbamoyl-AMP synthase [Calditrichota bacterium]